MIYDYGLYLEIFNYLDFNLPPGSIMKVESLAKAESLAQAGDLVIFFGWGNVNMQGQRRLLDKGVILMEDGETSLRMGNRIEQLRYVDTFTKYPLKRELIENPSRKLRQYQVPDIFNGDKVVVKLGNSHQGRDKYLLTLGYYFSTPESVVYEQFVHNARSIRVLIIGTAVFIVEHINAKHDWLGNIGPEEVLYAYENRAALGISNIDTIIEDALNIAKAYNIKYTGVDYVVNSEITGFLEINDMIGLPKDREVFRIAREYWLSVCKEYLGCQLKV